MPIEILVLFIILLSFLGIIGMGLSVANKEYNPLLFAIIPLLLLIIWLSVSLNQPLKVERTTFVNVVDMDSTNIQVFSFIDEDGKINIVNFNSYFGSTAKPNSIIQIDECSKWYAGIFYISGRKNYKVIQKVLEK